METICTENIGLVRLRDDFICQAASSHNLAYLCQPNGYQNPTLVLIHNNLCQSSWWIFCNVVSNMIINSLHCLGNDT